MVRVLLHRCAHAPHHVPTEWSDKYTGKFDEGWDALREETFERQKKLGVVPQDTELTERPDLFPAWDSLSDPQRKLYARQMEVFAGFSENADWNVGRLLDSIEEMGELDNTLIIYIWGDNGASMEGTITGSFNETTFFNGVVLEADEQMAIIEEKFGGVEDWGGFHTAPHFAAAWAHADAKCGAVWKPPSSSMPPNFSMIAICSSASRTTPLKKVVSLNEPVRVPSMLAPLSPQM